MTQFILPRWYDLHAHFRQGEIMPALIRDHLRMGCAGILAMPNTRPPVGKIARSDDLPYLSLEEYTGQLRAAGGDAFREIIVPLYLTKDTTPAMIELGVKAGLLRACKYYPPHGTTGADFSHDFTALLESDLFRAMEDNGVILCVHGEEHEMASEDYFTRHGNAEESFYREKLPRLIDACPGLRIVAEHITTRTAAALVAEADNLAATITPQHLLYTAGHLLRGLKYHLYCLPLVKFAEDRKALRDQVTNPANSKFFAGTDSAPHSRKVTPCGCAAGCYTGGIAPQLYAQAFEEAGCDLTETAGQEIFRQFLCLNGPGFYGLTVPEEKFTLTRAPQEVRATATPEGPVIPLPLGLESSEADKTAILPWRLTV